MPHAGRAVHGGGRRPLKHRTLAGRDTGVRSDNLNDPRNPLTFAIRFTCGALLGVLVGFGMWGTTFPMVSAPTAISIVAVTTVICGLLAAYLGDEFWTKTIRWLPWW